jgi:hypothetical protein
MQDRRPPDWWKFHTRQISRTYVRFPGGAIRPRQFAQSLAVADLSPMQSHEDPTVSDLVVVCRNLVGTVLAGEAVRSAQVNAYGRFAFEVTSRSSP